METIKIAVSNRVIPQSMFEVCVLDGLTKAQISKLYTKKQVTTHKSVYYLQKFDFHIKNKFNLDIREYCIEHLNIDWPRCPVDNELVWFKIGGNGLNLSRFHAKKGAVTKENCPKFAEFCERISIERKGAGNPMFGREAWNKGLTKDTNESLRAISEKSKGKKVSQETREKMRQVMLASPLKARHTTPHSEETKEFLRQNTARLWSIGTFSGRKTSIEKKMGDFLAELKLKVPFVEQFQLKYYTFDFALPEAKLGIECQGSWYHVDPRLYPNGATHGIQKRNLGRDKAKRQYASKEGWEMFEVWETEINNGEFKNIALCKLKELNLLEE